MSENLWNGILGMLLGALIGGVLGLGVCVWIISGTWLFPGDTILIGAIICGGLGFWFGEPFLDFLKALFWWLP